MKQALRFLFLTLITLMVSGMSYAGDVFTISFNGNNEQSTDGYFSWNTAKHNFSNKFNGAEYAGISFTNGLKMESATYVNFTSTAVSTVTIVQSTWSSNTIKFDGAELAVADAAAGTGCRIYTINDVEDGTHSITRGSGESGLFYVKVEYTGTVLTELDDPAISYDSTTGKVTITGDANATSIVYTTDGSEPSATNGEVYKEVFTVADGTIVKAICLGDGESYTNSGITTKQVLLDISSVAAPTFKVAYGTVAIACQTAATTIEYSTDGTNFSTYTKPITFFEDVTIHARATRGELVSQESSTEVTAVSKGNSNNSIVMHFDAFDVQRVNELSTLVGKDEAKGYSISLNNSGKTWTSANSINGNTSIKLSNGAQNTLYLPSGVSATRITFYSYINSASGRASGWKEVGDVETKYADVPMGAWNDAVNPDIRTYPLTGTETSINFTNTGEQLCFYIVLDVIDNVEPIIYEEILTYSMDNENYAVKEDLEAGNGIIYFGADKREESTISACGYGYKCDGDAAPDGSKFALLKPSRPLQIGDVINISAYATSNGGGLSLYPTRDGEPLVTLRLPAKNAEETMTYTVEEGDGLAGLSSIYVFRIAGKSTYFTDVHIIGEMAKENAEFEIVSISYAGLSTMYYGSKALVVPEGVRAFTAKVEGRRVIEGTVYEAGATIPAGEAVIIEGEVGQYNFAVSTTSGSATEDNLLRGSDRAEETTGGDKYYKLTTKNGLVGFYFGAANGGAFTNAAHKAYLAISGDAAADFYTFDSIEGIDTVNASTTIDNGAIFNLQGVRMDGKSLKKGIYVVNGKKIVVR